eukprot:TRINITY_DN1794_c0_g1_i10.p2 TRINITY_DN1794_c0_g1~~TRINITY_DN1794_c0_g1_i10.p2  ORF type:complete len:296 (-),score=60.05 TRINITY_DN1794_c0_g1_i10:1089-1976(-)
MYSLIVSVVMALLLRVEAGGLVNNYMRKNAGSIPNYQFAQDTFDKKPFAPTPSVPAPKPAPRPAPKPAPRPVPKPTTVPKPVPVPVYTPKPVTKSDPPPVKVHDPPYYGKVPVSVDPYPTTSKKGAKPTTIFIAYDEVEPVPEPECSTVAQVAANTPELSVLVEAVTAVGLLDALNDPALVATILAPTNEAFEALAATFGTDLETILGDMELTNILTYHLIPEVAAFAADLENGAELGTFLGQTLTVDTTNGVMFKGFGSNATVVAADIPACEAVVHVIDTVLLPDFSATAAMDG